MTLVGCSAALSYHEGFITLKWVFKLSTTKKNETFGTLQLPSFDLGLNKLYTKVDDDNDDYVYTMNVIAGDEIYFFLFSSFAFHRLNSHTSFAALKYFVRQQVQRKYLSIHTYLDPKKKWKT